MLKPFADYRLAKSPVLILEKSAILAVYGYRRYNGKIKHLATKCWLGALFAKFTLYVNSDGGDEEDRTLYLLNAMGVSARFFGSWCRLKNGVFTPIFGILLFEHHSGLFEILSNFWSAKT